MKRFDTIAQSTRCPIISCSIRLETPKISLFVPIRTAVPCKNKNKHVGTTIKPSRPELEKYLQNCLGPASFSRSNLLVFQARKTFKPLSMLPASQMLECHPQGAPAPRHQHGGGGQARYTDAGWREGPSDIGTRDSLKGL